MSDFSLGSLFRWQWQEWWIQYSYRPCLTTESQAPALLVHGFGASLGHWRSNIVPLSQVRPVYAIDLLGCGGSDKPTQADYSVDLWVDQIYDFWRAHIQQPVLLCGHSLGGLIAVTLAARHPEMVHKLSLISCADGPHPEEFPAPIGCLIKGACELAIAAIGFPLTYPFIFRQLRSTKTLRRSIANVYKLDERVDDELVEIFQKPAFEEGAQEVFLQLFRAILTRGFESPRLLLPQIQVPILVIWGQDDPAVPSFFADKFKQWQPSIDLIKLPGIGHCAHDELPQWVSYLISEWAIATNPRPQSLTRG